MQKIIIPMIASMLILSSLVFALPINDAYAQNNKVSLCHTPSGNPDNAHTISVSENAIESHLAHGDFMGTCEDGPDCRNYPEQQACEIKGNLIINLKLENGEIPTAAYCIIGIHPTGESIRMDADVNGVVVFQLPEETTSISGTCYDPDSGNYRRIGSMINPQEVTVLDIILWPI